MSRIETLLSQMDVAMEALATAERQARDENKVVKEDAAVMACKVLIRELDATLRREGL